MVLCDMGQVNDPLENQGLQIFRARGLQPLMKLHGGRTTLSSERVGCLNESAKSNRNKHNPKP